MFHFLSLFSYYVLDQVTLRSLQIRSNCLHLIYQVCNIFLSETRKNVPKKWAHFLFQSLNYFNLSIGFGVCSVFSSHPHIFFIFLLFITLKLNYYSCLSIFSKYLVSFFLSGRRKLVDSLNYFNLILVNNTKFI